MDLLVALDERGVATLTLDRPRRRNALDRELVTEIAATLRRFDADSGVRVVTLRGSGGNFCAGADIAWMRALAEAPPAERLEDSSALAEMFHALHSLTKPTVALVEGAAFGGAVGLVACCDVAIAESSAKFSASEVRLGLLPAVVGPYVVRAIGARAARAFILTAEAICAEEALRIGLVQRVASDGALEAARDRVVEALLLGAPCAQTDAKALVELCSRRVLDADLRQETAQLLAARLASAEGAEGLNAFLERRAPAWRAPGA